MSIVQVKIPTPNFDNIIATIQKKYEFKPMKENSWFRLGNYTNNDGHTSKFSLLIIAYAVLQGFTVLQTLALFCEHADMVEKGEEGHDNVRALLNLKNLKKGGDKISQYVQFQNDENPLRPKNQNGENACGNG